MKSYEVIMTDDADENIEQLGDYIAYDLHSPDVAQAYVEKILGEIKERLSYLPERFILAYDEPDHSRQIRRMQIDNHFAYYRIDEDAAVVYVLNIVYNRRDQLRLLQQMKYE